MSDRRDRPSSNIFYRFLVIEKSEMNPIVENLEKLKLSDLKFDKSLSLAEIFRRVEQERKKATTFIFSA